MFLACSLGIAFSAHHSAGPVQHSPLLVVCSVLGETVELLCVLGLVAQDLYHEISSLENMQKALSKRLKEPKSAIQGGSRPTSPRRPPADGGLWAWGTGSLCHCVTVSWCSAPSPPTVRVSRRVYSLHIRSRLDPVCWHADIVSHMKTELKNQEKKVQEKRAEGLWDQSMDRVSQCSACHMTNKGKRALV